MCFLYDWLERSRYLAGKKWEVQPAPPAHFAVSNFQQDMYTSDSTRYRYRYVQADNKVKVASIDLGSRRHFVYSQQSDASTLGLGRIAETYVQWRPTIGCEAHSFAESRTDEFRSANHRAVFIPIHQSIRFRQITESLTVQCEWRDLVPRLALEIRKSVGGVNYLQKVFSDF